MPTWILTQGEYSDYSVLGVFPDEATAERIAEQLKPTEDDYGSYHVERVHTLAADVMLREVQFYDRIDFIQHDGQRDPYPWSGYQGENVRTGKLVVPLADQDLTPCKVSVRAHTAMNTNVLGVQLRIEGTGPDRCRRAWSERWARLLAEPAVTTVGLWVASLRENGISDYMRAILDDPVNAPILPAIERALAAA